MTLKLVCRSSLLGLFFPFFCGAIIGEDAVAAEGERPGGDCGANPGGEEAVAVGWLSGGGGFGGFGCGGYRVWGIWGQ